MIGKTILKGTGTVKMHHSCDLSSLPEKNHPPTEKHKQKHIDNVKLVDRFWSLVQF